MDRGKPTGETRDTPPELPPEPCGCGCGSRGACLTPTGYRRPPDIRALRPGEAGRSLASRLAPVADRMRQLNTRFGIRPYRVFLCWTTFGGTETGEGYEQMRQRIELLPTPRVTSLDNIAFSPWHAGILQVGSLKVTEVSCVAYGEDVLRGFDQKLVPGLDLTGPNPTIPEPWDFFYEVVEDGRGGGEPDRPRFRLANTPHRDASKAQWEFTLERTSRERTRKDRSYFGEPGGPL